jgi:hypothetical protein
MPTVMAVLSSFVHGQRMVTQLFLSQTNYEPVLFLCLLL